MVDRPLALVTAPFRGSGLAQLEARCEVVLDPWIDHRPLRLYNAGQLAERIDAESADVLIVESDSVKGPVFERRLRVIGSCRGDPTLRSRCPLTSRAFSSSAASSFVITSPR